MSSAVIDYLKIENNLALKEDYSAKTNYYLKQTDNILKLQEEEQGKIPDPVIQSSSTQIPPLNQDELALIQLSASLQLLRYYYSIHDHQNYKTIITNLFALFKSNEFDITTSYYLAYKEFLQFLIDTHQKNTKIAALSISLIDFANLNINKEILATDALFNSIELMILALPHLEKKSLTDVGVKNKAIIKKSLTNIYLALSKKLEGSDEQTAIEIFKLLIKLIPLYESYTDHASDYLLKLAKHMGIKKHKIMLAEWKIPTLLPGIPSLHKLPNRKLAALLKKLEKKKIHAIKQQTWAYAKKNQENHASISDAYKILKNIDKRGEVPFIDEIKDPFLKKLLTTNQPFKNEDISNFENNRHTTYAKKTILKIQDFQAANQETLTHFTQEEIKMMMYHLHHFNHFAEPELIKNIHLKTLLLAYYQSLLEDVEIALLYKKLEYYQQKKNQERYDVTLRILANRFKIDITSFVHDTKKIKKKIDKKILTEKIDIDLGVTSKSFIDGNLALINKFKRYTLPGDLSQALETGALIVKFTLKKTSPKLNDIKNKEISDLAAIIAHPEKLKPTVLALWQQMLVCPDQKTIHALGASLVNILQISKTQLNKAIFWGWLPFRTSVKELIRKELINQQYLTMDYNYASTIIDKTRTNLLKYYQYKNRYSKNKEQQKLQEAAHKPINLLLFHLNLYGNFEHINSQDIKDKYLRKVIKDFNQNDNNYYISYRNIRQSYRDILDSTIKKIKGKILIPQFDSLLIPILSYLEKDGGPVFLEKIYHKFFKHPAKSIKNHQDKLNQFLEFTLNHVMEVQETAFEDYHINISEKQLFSTLRTVKKALNRYAEKHNLQYGIKKTPAHKKIFLQCQYIINQLPAGPKKQYYANLIQHDFEDPLSPYHLTKLKGLFGELISYCKTQKTPVKIKRCWYEIKKRKNLTIEKKNLRHKKARIKKTGKIIALTLALGQGVITGFIFAPALAFLGPFAPIGVVLFFVFATIGTFKLFKHPINSLFKQFFIRQDWFSSYKTPSGKFWVGFVLPIFALLGAFSMTTLVSITATTILAATLGLPLFIVAPVILSLAVCTFIGFGIFIYHTVMNINSRIYHLILKWFPEIENEGNGLKGIFAGIAEGLLRLNRNMLAPGRYSITGGYRSALLNGINKIIQTIKNPTGDQSASLYTIFLTQLELLTRGILITFFFALGVTLFIFATVATFTLIYSQFNLLLSVNSFSGLAAHLAGLLSVTVVGVFAGIIETFFNFVGAFVFLHRLTDITYDYILLPIAKAICEPIVSFRRLNEWLHLKLQQLIDFKDNFKAHPLRMTTFVCKRIFSTTSFIVGGAIFALNTLNLFSKLTGLFNKSSIPTTPKDWVKTTATFSTSSAGNSLKLFNAHEYTELNSIPLQKTKKHKELEAGKVQKEITLFRTQLKNNTGNINLEKKPIEENISPPKRPFKM